MDQEWFEMADIRRRKLCNSVWIPLRMDRTRTNDVEHGSIGFREEYDGAGSLAVWLMKKQSVSRLGWGDLGPSRGHHVEASKERYVPPDSFQFGGQAVGMHLVLDQHLNKAEPNEWHLHQDLVFALHLKREGDQWVAPNEGYEVVARLKRKVDGNPELLEFRAEQLRDYLCAREMALCVVSFHSRTEIVEDATNIRWPGNRLADGADGDSWEGSVVPIHEGGMPFGGTVKVLHASRTDVHPDDDVPTFGPPASQNVTTSSWAVSDPGRRLFMVSGELKRTEWIEPGNLSPRVRKDSPPPTVSFITDAKGTKENRLTLTKGSRWLWFSPHVVAALTQRRGGRVGWFTRDTGHVRCSPDDSVHFGVNKSGLVNVFAKDIGQLSDWQQAIWAGFNVSPEGGVSEELLAAQMRARPAQTKAPETQIARLLPQIDDVFLRTQGFRLFRNHPRYGEILASCHRFRAVDQDGLFALAKDLARLTADRIEASAVQKLAPPPKDVKWGSLKSLEKFFAQRIGEKDARDLMAPLFGLYELRLADAHLQSNEIEISLKKAGVDPAVASEIQGFQLLHAHASCLDRILRAANVQVGG
jgi:hypothetical protein